MKPYRFARYLEFNRLFEHFFVAAIVTIVLIRLYLHLAGYPQVAAGNFHIAHMLWGGLAMMLALLGSLLFLNNDAKNTWAVLGGAGFGAFVDELGKFITKDNNYFFQPTFAIMYVIFVVLYLIYRNIWNRQKFSSEEYLLNSVEELKEVITKELDKDEIAKALHYLSLSDPKNQVTRFLKRSFKEITQAEHRDITWYQKWRNTMARWYTTLIANKWVLRGVVGIFIIRAVTALLLGSAVLIEFATEPLENTVEDLLRLEDILPFINAIGLLVQTALTVFGAIVVWKSRIMAYRAFRNALLISILILQVFNFYADPAWALFGTARDLLLLTIIEYMIEQEHTKHVHRQVADQT